MPMLRFPQPLREYCIAYQHIPRFGNSDRCFLQCMSIASTTGGSDANSHQITTADSPNTVRNRPPTTITITKEDIKNAPTASSLFEDTFFPAGKMERSPKISAPMCAKGKLLPMELDDPNQMLSLAELDRFRRTRLQKEIYNALTDDLTGKQKHSLRFKGQIIF